jgi:di/tricarboxylate transporter
VLTLTDRLTSIHRSKDLTFTGASPASPRAAGGDGESGEELRTERMPAAVAILVAVVTVAAAGLLPIYIAALAGVVAMVATGCLRMPEAYDAVDWKVILLLAGVIPLGIAMTRSGAADLLARWIVVEAGGLPPVASLALFYLVTVVLANVMSSLATLVLMAPVAVEAASHLGADPFTFLLAVTFAANAAFVSPVGYQTNLMVLTPGGYRFSDFVRVGAPLQLLLAVLTPLVIAGLWGL